MTNTAAATGNPELSAYDREIYERASALLKLPLQARRDLLIQIEKKEGFDVANEIKTEMNRLWEGRKK